MKRSSIYLLSVLSLISACGTADTPSTGTTTVHAGPVAKKVVHEMTEHGNVRNDDYFWMRLSDEQKKAETPDAQTQDVLDYLNEENAYRKTELAHTDGLQKELFDEIVARIKQDDSSVPYKLNGYLYYNRFEKGQDYPLYCRKQGSEKGKEEIMLNVPELAKGHAYYHVAGQDVSTNNQVLGYAVDTVSRRQYTIYFKDLKTGSLLPDVLTDVDGGITWANDNKTVFYTVQDTVTLRSYRIYKHTLGTPQSADPLVYEEKKGRNLRHLRWQNEI